MPDSLSIGEAIEQASSTLSNEVVKETTPEVVETKPTEETQEDETKTSTPGETEVKETEKEREESFTDIDPKTLPPELKSVYDNLNKGYTHARQKEKAELKELKSQLEQLKTQKVEPQKEEKLSLTNEELLQLTPDQYIQYMTDRAVQESKRASEAERENTFKETAVAEYNNLDERLSIDNDVTYDPKMDKFVSGELDRQLAEFAEEKGTIVGFDYKSAGKKLIEEWDQYMDASFKKYIARQNQIAKNSTEKFAPKNPGNKPGASKPNGEMSLKEAIFAARQSLTN